MKSAQKIKETTDDNEELLQPENQNKHYDALFSEINSGQIKLPMFQRDFVWDKEQSARLIDSILKGFPIGTFIFWKTKEKLRSYKNLGNHKLPTTPKGDFVQYILDGQQRMTSLFAIRKGIRITKDGEEIDYKDIYIDLDYDPKLDEQIVVTECAEGRTYISVHETLAKNAGFFYKTFSTTNADQIDIYKRLLTNYDFSTILIKDYPIEVACEVFSRINTGGKVLTIFEIMVAKTYDETKDFDLMEKYEELRDGADDNDKSLKNAKFETIPESTVMQCVSAIFQKAVRSKDILKIRRETFIEHWPLMKDALFNAVDFVRTQLKISTSQLLPYSAILVPIAYFFHLTKNKRPSNNQHRLLEQFFYWVGITERYSSGTESKIADDLTKMQRIAEGKTPDYQISELHVAPQKIKETWFSAGNAYCKSILCLLASLQPRSFDTDGLVILDNSNLKIATSRNYHHFFPKNYLSKHAAGKEANLIANITLIDGYSNKHRIRARAPSEYIALFKKENRKIESTLQTHLIDNLNKSGVLEDDYDAFITYRSKKIAALLNEKLA